MFSTCSELTPRAPIPDGRMERVMQPCALLGVECNTALLGWSLIRQSVARPFPRFPIRISTLSSSSSPERKCNKLFLFWQVCPKLSYMCFVTSKRIKCLPFFLLQILGGQNGLAPNEGYQGRWCPPPSPLSLPFAPQRPSPLNIDLNIFHLEKLHN